jgi:tetratricopeptide (TPR) repeat protein
MAASMGRLRRLSIPIVLALLAAGRARAQAEDAVQRAHMHFEAGQALYKLGNFTEAVREFTAGYELAPRPGFLLNLGQCYIAMHQLDKAHEMYQRWLHDAALNDPKRPEAEEILREIERKLDTQAAGPEGTRTGETPPPLLNPAPTTVRASAPPHKPWIKRNWWVIPVSLVVAGAAVGVGVYFGTRNDPCAGAIGCYALSGKGSL